ncbi:hypothetical protein [Salinilacihabitans rarus]|uniref:hypothetical protein n=1 Tax=Salinilacihabitans rarus TaxID=2961596 RepID=UPI0020C88B85|nr:hypothetical protein [Salinilacihabitans rarus]
MAVERSDTTGDRRAPSPNAYGDVDEIEQRHVERALNRLASRGDLTDDQREAVAELARSITSSLAPAAIATVRAGRTTPGESVAGQSRDERDRSR